MTWLLWRQHRLQAVASAVLLVTFGVAVLTTGFHMADLYHQAVTQCQNCILIGSLFQGYGAIIDLVNITIALPVLLSVAFGAILISRETEQSTHLLAWTQSIGRDRWLALKLVTAMVATGFVSATVSTLVTWWSSTPNALYADRFEPLKFDSQNLMPVAFSLFAVALGIAAGAVFRRTLPAIAVTVGGFLAIRIPIEIYIRPYYQAAATMVARPNIDTITPPGAWVLGNKLIGPDGLTVRGPFDAQTACPTAANRSAVADCLGNLGYHIETIFQPASRYWHFQWIEAGIFTLCAATLVAVAYRHTLRRDA